MRETRPGGETRTSRGNADGKSWDVITFAENLDIPHGAKGEEEREACCSY